VVPTELTQALDGIAQAFGHGGPTGTSAGDSAGTPVGALAHAAVGRPAGRANGHRAEAVGTGGRADSPAGIGGTTFGDAALEDPRAALERARAEAADAAADADDEPGRHHVLHGPTGTPGS
jgi:hypothetical protein